MLTVPPDDSAPIVVILSSSVKSHKCDTDFVTFLKRKKKTEEKERKKNVTRMYDFNHVLVVLLRVGMDFRVERKDLIFEEQ